MSVEAIQYTRAPLQQEKDRVVIGAIQELCHAIHHQEEKLDVIAQYVDQYLHHIKAYESHVIDFGTLLQKLQPLHITVNNENNPNIEKLNSIVSIINGLHNSQQHEAVFRGLCQNLEELTHPGPSMPSPQIEYI